MLVDPLLKVLVARCNLVVDVIEEGAVVVVAARVPRAESKLHGRALAALALVVAANRVRDDAVLAVEHVQLARARVKLVKVLLELVQARDGLANLLEIHLQQIATRNALSAAARAGNARLVNDGAVLGPEGLVLLLKPGDLRAQQPGVLAADSLAVQPVVAAIKYNRVKSGTGRKGLGEGHLGGGALEVCAVRT